MTDVAVAILLSTILAAIAVYKKALTTGGLILAWISSVIITYCGGVMCFLALTITFILTIPAKHLKKADATDDVCEKTGKRDFMQVLCNVGTGTIMLLIGLFSDKEIFVLAYASAMAASLADCLASDIGVLSKEAPVDIVTLKRTEKGLSGGITILGLCAALIGAAAIGAVFVAFTGNFKIFLLVVLCGFCGALFDSLLGSLIQAKYRCQLCGKMTEKKKHCDKQTKHVRGIRLVNNDVVNLLNNIFAAVLALTLF